MRGTTHELRGNTRKVAVEREMAGLRGWWAERLEYRMEREAVGPAHDKEIVRRKVLRSIFKPCISRFTVHDSWFRIQGLESKH